MDTRKKEYITRSQTSGKKLSTSTNTRKETNSSSAKNTVSHSAMLAKGPAGGATVTGGASGGATSGASGRTSFADTSTTSTASDISVVLESSDQPDAPPVAAPADAPATPPELISFMHEMKGMFRNFTTQVNTKLDSVISEISVIKSDLESTKKTVTDLEIGITHTSDRLDTVENNTLPQLRKYVEDKLVELDEKLTLSEIHDRKQNLLVYGVPPKPNENIYETIQEIFCAYLNIPKKDAMMIPIANAHRLPPANRDTSGSGRQPPAIIVRFARMSDRDRLLHAFEHRPNPTRHQQMTPPGTETPLGSSSPSSDSPAGAYSVPTAFARVTIRTDLPPKMKRERGRLASIAFNIRKNNNLATRIRISGTKVFLQTRKPIKLNGGMPDQWKNWKE